MMKLAKRLRYFWQRGQMQRELAEEMRIHREMGESRLRDAGASADEARHAVRRDFGNETLALEESRGVWLSDWLDALWQDAHYAARSWVRSPGFAVTVITTIGLALGLNTALFTAFDHYVLRPLAVRDPGSLYQVEWSVKSGAGHFFAWQEFEQLRAQKEILNGAYAAFGVVGQLNQQPAFGQLVTADFFEMLGARTALGRPFSPSDAVAPGTGAYMVLGHSCWRGKFGADPNILGKTVYVRGQPFEVVGVAVPEFTGIGPVAADFWVPLTMYGALNNGTNIFEPSKTGMLVGVVRLRPDVSLETAKAGLLMWARQLTKDYPAEERAAGIYLESRATAIPLNADVVLAFVPIFAAFGLVLLTACANVSNMMLARALMRQREIGIRLSLGAGRLRLIRQLLTEAFLLSLPAGLLGFVISEATVRGLRDLFFHTVPPRIGKVIQIPEIHPDWRVFGFIVLAAALTTLLFGLVPAIQATRGSVAYANRGDFGNDFRPSRFRNALVVVQVLVCALMLITSLIILRSESRIATRDLRVEPRGVLDLRLQSKFAFKIAERFRQESIIESVAAVSRAPLYGGLPSISLGALRDHELVQSYFNQVSPEYFGVLRIPLVNGRDFTSDEAKAQSAVTIVSETTARRFWPNENALGKEIEIKTDRLNRFYASPSFTTARVVGVARDVINGYGTEKVDPACVYFPLAIGNAAVSSLLVRVHGNTEAGRLVVERVIQQTAPGAADLINPLEEVVGAQIYPFRVLSWVAGFLALLAMVMVISGIYGVLSFLVNQRKKEIGIRVAVGASKGNVVSLILGQSMRLAILGTVLGTGAALAIAPLAAHEIDALRPYELLPYGAAVTLILLAAGVAAFVPSRRAAGLDPASTLRSE